MPAPRKHSSPSEKQKAYRRRQTATRIAELRAKGLPALPSISSMPGTARWKAMQDAATALLGAMIAEMEAYRDERSQDWQESESGAAFEEWIQQVQEACDSVEGIC